MRRPFWGSELVADEEELLAYGRRFDPWPMHSDPDIGEASPLGGLVRCPLPRSAPSPPSVPEVPACDFGWRCGVFVAS